MVLQVNKYIKKKEGVTLTSVVFTFIIMIVLVTGITITAYSSNKQTRKKLYDLAILKVRQTLIDMGRFDAPYSYDTETEMKEKRAENIYYRFMNGETKSFPPSRNLTDKVLANEQYIYIKTLHDNAKDKITNTNTITESQLNSNIAHKKRRIALRLNEETLKKLGLDQKLIEAIGKQKLYINLYDLDIYMFNS